jgi:hypothetical protein
LGDFKIINNCAGKIVWARELASNWESLLRENISLPTPCIIAGIEFIEKDDGIVLELFQPFCTGFLILLL